MNCGGGPLTETPLDDATLVALAALHHADERLLEMPIPEKAFEVLLSDDDKANPTPLPLRLAIKEHTQAGLPWPPTPEQVARFKELAQGIYIR